MAGLTTDEPPPVLRYANPGVLFARRFTYRTRHSAIGVFATFAGAAALIAPVLPPAVPIAMRVSVGAALVVVGCYGVFLIAVGWSWDVRITEDGIEKGRRFRPWAVVRSIGGCRGGPGGRIVLECMVGTEFLNWGMTLPTTPPMTDDEFDRLIRMLDLYLSQTYPHIKVERVPRNASD